jgi:DNA-binding NtrC family response regulator
MESTVQPGMAMGKVLLVDDEPNTRRVLSSNLRRDGHEIFEVGGVEEARAALAGQDFDAVFTDQRMLDGDGLQVLETARQVDPTLSVVVLTAVATIELAVESMRQGAFDFLTKPFQPEVIGAAAKRACEHTGLLRENLQLRNAVGRLERGWDLFGDDPSIREARQRIARVAPTNATVLITGETGTGKELVARAIHRQSPRASKPFVAVNCAAFTETLLEAELFGHEKGAFTGADQSRAGLFEAANEGTLFLDEAGEMSMAAQGKLLRVLTEGQLSRVGSTRPRKIDVRVLVATHRNLEQRVKDGTFREDLFYRLAVVPIHLVPLRERLEDISGLWELFSRQVAADLNRAPRSISPEALANLKRYPFPGNLRELRNLIERAYILSSREEIGIDDLPLPRMEEATIGSQPAPSTALPTSVAESFNLTSVLEQTEKDLILRVLSSTGGAQAEAARRMGLSRSALAYKLNKYGIRATGLDTQDET